MLKFSAGYIRHREAHLIGLGLTDENLQVLLVNNKPIHVTSEQLSLAGPGFDILIFAAKDQDGIKRRGLELIEANMSEETKRQAEKETVSLPCMHMDKTFYLFPFINGDRGVFIVGLDEVAFAALRSRSFPTFRVRDPEGRRMNVEVLMFWGSSVEAMEEGFYASGLITRDTHVTAI